jgi:hypothetical protein
VFAVAISPTGGRKYFVEVSTLQIVHELSTSATRQDIKNEAAIRFGAGDYIAVEDIKDTEVAMNVTLR